MNQKAIYLLFIFRLYMASFMKKKKKARFPVYRYVSRCVVQGKTVDVYCNDLENEYLSSVNSVLMPDIVHAKDDKLAAAVLVEKNVIYSLVRYNVINEGAKQLAERLKLLMEYRNNPKPI